MKKQIVFMLALMPIMNLLAGCSRAPQISRSVSADNFLKYEAKLREVSKKHKLAMEETEIPVYDDDYDASRVSKNFSISYDGTEIDILLSNDALDFEEEGEETFLISYMLPVNKEYDLDLFAELVNTVSGRAISAEYCQGYLKSLDVIDKDSLREKKGFSHSKPLDWEGNWNISYSLRDSGFQELQFNGLTIAMTSATDIEKEDGDIYRMKTIVFADYTLSVCLQTEDDFSIDLIFLKPPIA